MRTRCACSKLQCVVVLTTTREQSYRLSRYCHPGKRTQWPSSNFRRIIEKKTKVSYLGELYSLRQTRALWGRLDRFRQWAKRPLERLPTRSPANAACFTDAHRVCGEKSLFRRDQESKRDTGITDIPSHNCVCGTPFAHRTTVSDATVRVLDLCLFCSLLVGGHDEREAYGELEE